MLPFSGWHGVEGRLTQADEKRPLQLLTEMAKPSKNCPDTQTQVHTHIHSYTLKRMHIHTQHTLPYTPTYRDTLSHVHTYTQPRLGQGCGTKPPRVQNLRSPPLSGSLRGRIGPKSRRLLKFCTPDAWLSSPWSAFCDTRTHLPSYAHIHTHVGDV